MDGAVADLDRGQVRQEVISHEEAHEDEVVDDLLEVIPARHTAPVRADELLVQVLAQDPDLAQAEGRRPLLRVRVRVRARVRAGVR